MIADIEADDAAATAHRVNAENEGRERPKLDSTGAIKIQKGIIMKRAIKHISQLLLPIAFAILSASFVLAQSGTPLPNNSDISDQNAGSVLIFNYYGSHASYPALENTEIHITNTNLQKSASMTIFFIDAASGDVDNASLCLAANQTASFLMADVDPGAKGYIIAVSVDFTGQPNNFNYFIGSESIRMASGHVAALNAETISALTPSSTGVSNGIAATLKFDGVHYNKVPYGLALDHVPATVDGNKTLVIVNQIGGSLLNGHLPDNLTTLTGTVYDRATNAHFWQVGDINSCQFRKVIANDFPQTMPNMSTLIAPGQYGWMKFWPIEANKGVTGAVLYLNVSTPYGVSRFIGGRNLHHLALTTDELTIPVIPPVC
ncbi:MAG: hypothetical protein ABI977_32240 [Acidobacteriota bacterium]